MASTYSGQGRNEFNYLPPMGVGQPGAVGGGGGSIPEPFFRDLLDARRSMYRRTPSAEYPDGYLGTITSRRGDRLLDAVKHREGGRSYVRGVHKGERIDPGDYIWPDEFNPMSGLEAEAEGRRQRPIGIEVPYASPEMVFPAKGAWVAATENPVRKAQLRRLSPSWR